VTWKKIRLNGPNGEKMPFFASERACDERIAGEFSSCRGPETVRLAQAAASHASPLSLGFEAEIWSGSDENMEN